MAKTDLPLFTKYLELLGDELRSVVGDNFIRQAVPTNYVFPDEVPNLDVSYVGVSCGLNLF